MNKFLNAAILILGLALAIASAQAEYRIAAGDLLSIAVFGEPDLSLGNVRVPENGKISYPLLGEVYVVGRTAKELERNFRFLLKDGYLRKPDVTVTILEYQPFYIRGAVKAPGSYAYKEGMNIEKAVTRAGGFGQNALRDKITLLRDGAQDGEPQGVGLGTPIRPGDVITVGGGETAASFFYVYGEVATPGSYPYRVGLTVEKAIVLAGGFGVRASRRKVSISRGDPAERLKGVALSTPIQVGDVITVGMSLF